MKEEKMQILWLVGITVSEVLVMAEITFNGTKKKDMLFNLLSPMSDQDRISPYNVITISSRQVMRIKKNIDKGIISWSKTKFSKLTSQELYGGQEGELLMRS